MSAVMEDALQRAIGEFGIERICVVSPHLDDAVFSLAHFLRAPRLPPREVFTVFTTARADSDSRHARAMGFTGPIEEFEARRDEDRRAMAMLGIDYEHAGAEADRFTAEVADTCVRRVVERAIARGVAPEKLLALLPAGAGGWLGWPRLWWRRLIRKPVGCPPHAEHEWVRDRLWPRLAGHGVRVGLYAEIPYLWADSVEDLAARQRPPSPQTFRVFRLDPDVGTKLEAVRCYASQYVSEFGTKPDYQRRTAALPEAIWLPVP